MKREAKDTVTVRVAPETKTHWTPFAAATNQDRSGVINEALTAYIETYQWQVAHIREGIRQAYALVSLHLMRR